MAKYKIGFLKNETICLFKFFVKNSNF